MLLFFLQFFIENFAMHVSIIYSNSINLDPKFDSSFASDLSLQSRLWACNARFLARKAKALKVEMAIDVSDIQTFSTF